MINLQFRRFNVENHLINRRKIRKPRQTTKEIDI